VFAMNPPPTVGLKTLIIFGLSFVKQLAHGLVKRFAGYVTLLNAFVLITQLPNDPVIKRLTLCSMHLVNPINLSRLSRSECVRDEMRPALWQCEKLLHRELISLGPKQPEKQESCFKTCVPFYPIIG
jgi:hypothetical protein